MLWLKRRSGRALLEYAAKGGSALVAYSKDGEDGLNEIPLEKPLQVEALVYDVDPVLRRKFHAIAGHVAKAMGKDPDDVKLDLKIYAGHCTTMFVGDYVVKVPKSISIKEGCDELKFRAFFDNAMVALTQEPFNIDPAIVERWVAQKGRSR